MNLSFTGNTHIWALLNKPSASLSNSKIYKHDAFALLNLETSIHFVKPQFLCNRKDDIYLMELLGRFEKYIRSRIDFLRQKNEVLVCAKKEDLEIIE